MIPESLWSWKPSLRERLEAWWWESRDIRGLALLLLILCLLTLAAVAYLNVSMAPVIEGVR